MKPGTEYALNALRGFMSRPQLACLAEACRNSEERNFFQDKVNEIWQTICNMPKTYETDGQGDSAIIHLHYFRMDMDHWITEKDCEMPQHQAFGYCDLGWGFPELGYVSIQELIANEFELDLYWTPITLGELKKEKAA